MKVKVTLDLIHPGCDGKLSILFCFVVLFSFVCLFVCFFKLHIQWVMLYFLTSVDKFGGGLNLDFFTLDNILTKMNCTDPGYDCIVSAKFK